MEYLVSKEIVNSLKIELKNKITTFKRHPKYVILLNENDSSSLGYCKAQKKLANELEIDVEIITMESDEKAYINIINRLNNDKLIDGILVTRPLFKGANEKKILATLSPYKDIDAVNPLALGLLFMNDNSLFPPATSEAVIKMLEYYQIDVKGKDVLVIGRSLSVGKSAAILLLNKDATVKIAHSKTIDLNKHLKEADIVVACVGKPLLIDGNNLKKDAIVIDCGIHYLDSGIVGDVKVSENLKMITKVPGGIGPLTSILLMEHVVKCYEVNNND